jgi:uncharacterized protein (TIGR02145 family)
MKKIISCFALAILLFACKKTELAVQTKEESGTASSAQKGGSTSPTVTTNAASFLTSATATSGGTVSTGGGGSNVTERGVCYNTSPDPTISNSKIISGSAAGSFTCVLSGLTGSTTYYVRAYATKSTGTTYGNQVSFTTLQHYGTVTDIDGNVYSTINIGGQVWLRSNLKTTRYRDGSAINLVTDDATWAGSSTTGAYCNYNHDGPIADVYGKLYNWWAAVDSRNIAPVGYHVASFAEWQTLQAYLGGANVAGGRVKYPGLSHWSDPNLADNAGGFSAYGGGGRFSYAATPSIAFFSEFHSFGNFWTSTSASSNLSDPVNPYRAHYVSMSNNSTLMYRSTTTGQIQYGDTRQGYSIRCIKD